MGNMPLELPKHCFDLNMDKILRERNFENWVRAHFLH